VIDFTTVLGVDAKTLEQLVVSAPTWRKYRPEMFARPFLVFYDSTEVALSKLRETLLSLGFGESPVRAVSWPIVGRQPYANQREKMLTGFCHVSRFVQTPWWLKVDTDAIALKPSDWAPAEWFEPDDSIEYDPEADRPDYLLGLDYDPRYNVIISSPWGYTKPGDQMAALDDWADGVDILAPYPRLDVPFTPGARRARHPRIASYVSFYRADWTRFASDIARHYCGFDKIPVPSQDGYHFYIAKRRGDRILRANMKRRGWTNCPRIAGLRATAARALNGDYE
jgi:hypothetical protein